jgi:hypothetical protein
VLMSITLSSGTETGSANSNGFMFGDTAPPVVTDPNFRFSSAGGVIEAPFFEFGVNYDMHWTDVAGQLTGVSLIYDNSLTGVSIDFSISGGLTGGTATNALACALVEVCRVTGFWQEEAQAVPEPGSAALLLGALFGFVLCGHTLAGRNRRIVGHA